MTYPTPAEKTAALARLRDALVNRTLPLRFYPIAGGFQAIGWPLRVMANGDILAEDASGWELLANNPAAYASVASSAKTLLIWLAEECELR